jgi:hypothetical protein
MRHRQEERNKNTKNGAEGAAPLVVARDHELSLSPAHLVCVEIAQEAQERK